VIVNRACACDAFQTGVGRGCGGTWFCALAPGCGLIALARDGTSHCHKRACAGVRHPSPCPGRSPSVPIPADARKTGQTCSTARRTARPTWHREIEQLGYGHNLHGTVDTQPKIQPACHAMCGADRACARSLADALALAGDRRLRCNPTPCCAYPWHYGSLRLPRCVSRCNCAVCHGQALERGPERERWGVCFTQRVEDTCHSLLEMGPWIPHHCRRVPRCQQSRGIITLALSDVCRR
jgi:hypothetical protein